ncbi:MAG: hypothetical protein ACNA7L_11585, partial [Roseinatronobacter sp.]
MNYITRKRKFQRAGKGQGAWCRQARWSRISDLILWRKQLLPCGANPRQKRLHTDVYFLNVKYQFVITMRDTIQTLLAG